jgi:phospholipid transport system substrate-binding protein
MNLFRPLLLAVLLVLASNEGSFAQTQSATGSATAPTTGSSSDEAQTAPAGKFIQDLGDKAISVMADKSLTPQQRNEKYASLLHDAFDIPAIGRFVLGRAWETATPAQQQEFLKLFQALVVKMYGARLNLYSGESFKVKGVRAESGTEMVVASVIAHTDGSPPTQVDWRVHKNNNGQLAVIDVSVAGVSQSLTQRQEYAAIIERNNGKIDALLDLMRQRLDQPSTNAPQG